ncbi:MAG TPA: cytochrome c biogenesis protein ResB [Candidatus Omnitrophota bacterium]|nr:cytochrome c biogenesis protein ResB [Candidatus Omnitrophota bacterium]
MTTKSSENKVGQSLFLNGQIARAVFKFFASLQLAIGTLSALMIILAVGTIVESRFSADAARILVYDTPWLTLILIVLVLNLACSAADRLPWQKKHIGFVLTHLGIIIVLAGSLATQEAAVDGQMSMTEGSSGKWVTLKEPMLYVYAQAFKEERMVPFKERALRWKGREKIAQFQTEGKEAQLFLTQFYPNVKTEAGWVAAEKGPGAVQVSLWNSFVNVKQWLADVPASRELPLGPAVLKWASQFAQPEKQPTQSAIELKSAEGVWSVPLPPDNSLPFEHQIADGFFVKILSLYRHAYVEENILKEGLPPEHADNPAAVLEITKDGKTERHTVFAQFPDFPTVHGKHESELGFQAVYIDPRFVQLASKNELRFVPQPDGLYYQIINDDKLKQGKVEAGKEVQTGWMDLKFKAEQVLPHAAADMKVLPLDDDDPSEAAVAAVSLEIQSSQGSQSFWLAEGLQKSLMLEDGLFEMVYGRRQLALGFEVMLKDFRVKFDPGTERPAAYESDVVVKDFTRGTSFEKTISMNQPLVYRGFHVYQAGYQQNPDGTESSVFAVARDPGIPLKYAGAAIMVFGILLMFYTRAYSSRNEKGLK